MKDKKVGMKVEKIVGKIVEKMRDKMIVTLLLVVGLLVTVNAIHAFEEAGLEKGIGDEVVDEAVDETMAPTTAASVNEKADKVVADEGVEETTGEGFGAVTDEMREEWASKSCEICEEQHDKDCQELNSEGGVKQEQHLACPPHEEEDCEQCETVEECSCCMECTSCERCLTCVHCLKCEGCGKCLDCTDCESCLDCEECVKCEECNPGSAYEEWQLPEIEVVGPDGSNDYYRRAPEIRIHHQLEGFSVHYGFTNGQGERTEGIVPKAGYMARVDFCQGVNTLEVWVELPDRNWIERRGFKLDSINPKEPRFVFGQPLVNGNVYSKDEVSISFESLDEGSGVYGYFYNNGNQEESFIAGERGELVIRDEFVGTIEVSAIDLAGNKSEVAVSPLIIIDKNRPMISISSAGDLRGWNQNGVPVEVKVEEWGVSSGLENVRVYLDNEVILERNFSQSEKRYLFRETLHIEKNSINGLGVNLRVEARDHVGNETMTSQNLLIDTKDPTLDFIDVFDQMIIGSDRTIEIELKDENLLSYYQVNILHSTFEKEESESALQGEIDGTSQRVSVNLEKEGWYVIEALGRDISGREVTATLNVLLDKTSPIIQYVEQLNGKHVPHFHWNYQSEEMIYDHLDFQYEMLLNRNRYVRGTLVDVEGEYVFQVNAKDEAGNESSAYANFVIDNTPPEIYFYNVDDGESYGDAVMAGVAVTKQGGRIKRVEVNGEIANIESNSQMVQLRLSHIDDYIITVEADDLAGNINIEEIRFSIVENLDELSGNLRVRTENPVSGIIEKVGGLLPDEIASAIANAVKEGSIMMKVMIGVGVLLVASGMGFLIYKKVWKKASL